MVWDVLEMTPNLFDWNPTVESKQKVGFTVHQTRIGVADRVLKFLPEFAV
jgi:hypothetical protein